MLAPGMTIDASGSVNATIGAATDPDFFNEGVGFMTNGDLAIDTDSPTGSIYRAGIRQSALGAFYGTTSTAGTDVYIGGLRVSAAGQLVYEVANGTQYVNGNPLTANARFAVN